MGDPPAPWGTLTFWRHSSETVSGFPGLVLNPPGVEQGLSLLCVSCIFFSLCQWGQLLSHSFAIKLFQTHESLLLLITVLAVLHTLIISPRLRQWPFLRLFFLLFLVKIENMNMYGFLTFFWKHNISATFWLIWEISILIPKVSTKTTIVIKTLMS